MTKYSTFSIAAAVRGNIPLINLYRDETAVGTRLRIWESALSQLDPSGLEASMAPVTI